MTAVQARPAAGAPVRTWRGVPVVLPSPRDPRLKVSAVILSLQVLGQTVLDFNVSIAQIVVTILGTALVEVAVVYRRQRALVWPGSALLTGNGVAFILRAGGTEHGDWWTLNGIHWFLAAALLGLASKYLLEVGGRHLFNPSNLGLVVVLLAVGSPWVYPQYLWWGDLSAPVVAAVLVIVAGAVLVLRPLGMLPMTGTFLAVFVPGTWALATVGDQCMVAIWHRGELCGSAFWQTVVLSPELLVFTFYMLSDPRTAPRDARARLLYGALVAVVALLLIAPQTTEYGVKVALLAALVLVCCSVPLLEHLSRREAVPRPDLRGTAGPLVAACAAVLVAVPLATVALGSDVDLIDLESGITPTGEPARQ